MKLKKILATFCCAVMAFCVAMPGFADSTEAKLNDGATLINGETVEERFLDSYNEGTLKFHSEGVERIASNGSFSFNTQAQVVSDKFQVSSSQTTVRVKANIVRQTVNGYVNVTSQYPNHNYTVEMRETGLLGKVVGKGTYYADGGYYQFTAVNLSTTKTYELVIRNNDSIGVVDYVDGSGTISNFKGVVG